MTMLRSGTIKYALGGAKAVAALVGDSPDDPKFSPVVFIAR
jgi:hypothetical protein